MGSRTGCGGGARGHSMDDVGCRWHWPVTEPLAGGVTRWMRMAMRGGGGWM